MKLTLTVPYVQKDVELDDELLRDRQLARGDVVETREGVCRLGPALARELGEASHPLRVAVAPHAEWLARQLLNDAEHPTPLTRNRHRQSRAASR